MTHEELKQREATYQASHDAFAEVVEWCNDKTNNLKCIEILAAAERDYYAKQLLKLEGQTVVIADETARPGWLAKGVRVEGGGLDSTGRWIYRTSPRRLAIVDGNGNTYSNPTVSQITIIPNPHNDKQLEQELREMGVE